MVDGINAVLERQREYHPSFVLMGGGFERSLLPWGRPIPNGERVAELDGGEELPLSECFRRSWDEGKHLFITGPGGVGKTVALLTFATEEGFLPRRTAAVYVPLYDLSQYADERRDCVDEYLGHTYSKAQLEAIDALSRKAWDGGPNVILLMDGYNEIPPERRRHVEAGMRKWAADRPGTQVVTTSRVPGLVGLAHTMRVGLHGLAKDEVSDYLSTRHHGVAIPEAGSPLARLLETPLMLRLYAGVEEYRQRVSDERVRFRDSRTAGDLVWNYLQAELHACMDHRGKYSERDYAEALLLTLPYVCWRMESAHEFKVDKEKLRQYVGDAAARWNGRDRPMYVTDADGGLTSGDVGGRGTARAHLSILEGVSGIVTKSAGEDYSLAHQSLRDGLAAIHLLNVATAPHQGLPAEFARPISEYVKDFSADLLGEDWLLELWEANRRTRPTDAVATNNLLRFAHKMLCGNLTKLDWSGMNLRGMSLFPFRRGTRLELSYEPERFDGTRLDVGCFMPQGHSDSVTSACFSPDGMHVASSSNDGTVRLWDAASGRQIGVLLKTYGDAVDSVCFSPDGSHLISGSGDGTVRQWNVALGYQSGDLLLRHERGISSVCFSPDGTLMAIGHYDGAVSLRTASSGWQSGIMLNGHQGRVESVSFSPDGTLVASGSRDGTVRLWSTTTYRQVGQPIDGQGGVVYSICFSLDGTSLATGSLDGFLRLWDVASGQQIGQLPGNHGAVVRSVSFSPDGTLLVGGYSDGTVRLWDVLSRQQVGRSLDKHGDKVYSVCFSPDGTLIASGHSDGMVRFWDAVSGRQVGQPLGGHRARVRCICHSPDGTIVASGATDGTVSVLDAKSGRRVGKQPAGHKYAVASVCFSPDGKLVASDSYDRTVRLWDVATGRQVCQPLVGHGGQILSVCFSPDGELVASGSWDRTIRLWDVATGKQVAILPSGREFPITSVCFSPNGALVAGGSLDRTVRLWDVATGQKVGSPLEPRRGGINSICFSPNGMLAVGCIDGSVQLWDTASEQQIGIGDKIDGPVESLAFSSRGLHAVHLEGGFAGITTIKPSIFCHPALLRIGRIPRGMKRIGLFIVLPLFIVFLLIDSALGVLSNDRASIRNLHTRVTNGAEFLFHDSDPLNHKDGNHIVGSYVTIAPLYGIDITGLDLTKARIDKRTKKILRKNDAKA